MKVLMPHVTHDHVCVTTVSKALGLDKIFHTISELKVGYFHGAFGKVQVEQAVQIEVLDHVDQKWLESVVKSVIPDLPEATDIVAIYDPNMRETRVLSVKMYGVTQAKPE